MRYQKKGRIAMKGYAGRIPWIDLTSGKISVEEFKNNYPLSTHYTGREIK